MAENKTRVEAVDIKEHLMALTPAHRQEDGLRLLDIFTEETGLAPEFWTGGMIGFGRYRYRYASGHGGEAFRTGFSMRKAGNISLYLLYDSPERIQLLQGFGKHKTGVSCVYINRLPDIDQEVLRQLIRATLRVMEEHYPSQNRI